VCRNAASESVLTVVDGRLQTRLLRLLDRVHATPEENFPTVAAQKKKAQESRKKGAASQLKEVKMGSQTSVHDVTFKVNHIREFLDEGHRVKVTVFFRGRQITHPELGREMLEKVGGMLTDVAVVEQSPRLEGRHMSMMLVSK